MAINAIYVDFQISFWKWLWSAPRSAYTLSSTFNTSSYISECEWIAQLLIQYFKPRIPAFSLSLSRHLLSKSNFFWLYCQTTSIICSLPLCHTNSRNYYFSPGKLQRSLTALFTYIHCLLQSSLSVCLPSQSPRLSLPLNYC